MNHSFYTKPRLFSRLSLINYQEEINLDEILRKRQEIIQTIIKQIHNINNLFSFEYFTISSNGKKQSHSNLQNIKKLYREFVDEVAIIADEGQQNPSWTMYNIIIKSKNEKEIASKIKSYFGEIDKMKLQKLIQTARALEDYRLPPNSNSSESIFSVTFTLPSLNSLEFSEIPTEIEVDLHNNKVEDDDSPQQLINWLFELTSEHVNKNKSSFDAVVLSEEILSAIQSSESEDHVQMRLFELVGEDGLHLLMDIFPKYHSLKKISMQTFKGEIQRKRLGNVNDNTSTKQLSANQRKKQEKRVQQSQTLDVPATQNIDWLREAGFREDFLEQERMLGLQGGNSAASPDSWLLDLAANGTREYYEKRGLPAGTKRTTGHGYEEVAIPAPLKVQMPTDELIPIATLEEWARLAFEGTKRLNHIQSKVFDIAYNTSENMLICAPTGAGKTNIAMLSYLQLVKQFVSSTNVIDKSFKAIYIAPMKALAQEVVEKFSQRLKPLGLIVREFTGDMQLSRQEIADSQLIVTTPEKWDVVTRKGGDGSLGTLVSLIIIDEIHLLAEDRGAVIETIVARTQRYIESSQSFVRIVGLSATLPNYKDVASFLRVNHNIGLFFFGPEYRPVPLDQTFIGVTEKQRVRRNDLMNRLAYDKVIAALQNDKQVMIFVHSRKETSKTIEALRDLIAKNNSGSLFENIHHEKYTLWKREVNSVL